MTGPTHGSLFSGYEGAGLALEAIWPDLETRWVSDIEPGPRKVLAHRYPDAPNLGDITQIDWADVEPVDIITGGSPCQDLSHAGKRAGMRPGTRSGLWASMHDAIDILRPSLVVWENVRGALSAHATTGEVESCGFCMADGEREPMRALGRVLGDLADIGYDTQWVGLRAADVGACHGRFRVFVVAWPADTDSPSRDQWRLAEPGQAQGGRALADHRGRGGEPVGPLLRTVMADEDGGGPLHPDTARERGQTLRLTGQILALTGDLLPTPAVNDMGKAYTPDEWDEWTEAQKAKHGNGNGHGKSLEIEAARTADEQVWSPDFAMGFTDWGAYGPAISRWETVLGRTAPDPTEPTGRNGRPRLSAHLTEWMMGLPAGWITDVPGITRNEALRLCGNGIVPQQMAEAVRWCLEQRALTESEQVAA